MGDDVVRAMLSGWWERLVGAAGGSGRATPVCWMKHLLQPVGPVRAAPSVVVIRLV
jgi:hypothetical protein